MASDEDNFDIDVYGDIDEHHTNDPVDVKHDSQMATSTMNHGFDGTDESTTVTRSEVTGEATEPFDPNVKNSAEDEFEIDVNGPISTEEKPPETQIEAPKQPPPKQGIKRKEGPDDRPMDNGATTAIFISDLHWWSTDDDIRGWINQSECEDELKDITFSEHKVNGKSKGQAFVEFTSPQAATAVKRKLESFSDNQQPGKKFTVTYTSATSNPYRTLPKDAPVRGKDGPRHQENRSSGGGYNSPGGMSNSPNQGSMNFGMNNFRGGGRGGFNRGGPMNNMGGFPNRSFSGPMGGGSPGGFQGGSMGGFPGPTMGGMPPYGGGYPNRGGMMGGMRGGPMGNRGGRGGMGPNGMMTGMPAMGGMGPMMGGMAGPMSGMGGNMGMGPMGMQGQAGGFQGPQPHFNPAFFGNQNQGIGGGGNDGNWGNPHGTKRRKGD